MDSRETTDFFDDELRTAMAEGRVIVEFNDTSDEENNAVKFTVRPAEHVVSAGPPQPASDNVELALAQRNAEIAEEKLEEREEALRQDIAGLRSQMNGVQERNKTLSAQLATKASTIVEKRTTVIHRRCWGSWFLAILVAGELFSRHHEAIFAWVAALHGN